ncbi:hypothetical protein V8G54_023282 [Vigna mungo]|uniref:Reverse transcriptase Ty1/copia-type domain-containing protein n=1 Tax=Vigna mungo TaxID=3915 RepID=A0AAQ3RSE1_VIGMU
MKNVFEMTYLGLMTYFLYMEIIQNKNDIFICQQEYEKEILKKFQLYECKIMNSPMNQNEKLNKEDETYFRSLVGRFDILFPVSVLSRFMHYASVVHLKSTKRVVRYIKGTINYGVK